MNLHRESVAKIRYACKYLPLGVQYELLRASPQAHSTAKHELFNHVYQRAPREMDFFGSDNLIRFYSEYSLTSTRSMKYDE